MRPLHHIALVLAVAGCTPSDPPRPGTQIGLEDAGECDDDVVEPVVDFARVPDGASESFEDASSSHLGRFVGATEGGDPLTLTVDADANTVEWVTRVHASSREPVEVCPPLWRVQADVTVHTDALDWNATGTLSMPLDEVWLTAEGPIAAGEPQEVEPTASRLFAFAQQEAYVVQLAWIGEQATDGDAVEEVVVRGTVEPE